MKVIVAGGRNITDAFFVRKAIEDSGFAITEIVSGGARGVDKLGELYAERLGIPIKRFPADWDKFGRAAGWKRNREMALYADALVAIWDGQSKGTKSMIDLARSQGLKVYVSII